MHSSTFQAANLRPAASYRWATRRMFRIFVRPPRNWIFTIPFTRRISKGMRKKREEEGRVARNRSAGRRARGCKIASARTAIVRKSYYSISVAGRRDCLPLVVRARGYPASSLSYRLRLPGIELFLLPLLPPIDSYHSIAKFGNFYARNFTVFVINTQSFIKNFP